MNYDITFCNNRKCKNTNCERNLCNADEMEIIIRNGISVAEFKDCKYFTKGETNEI